MMFLKNYDVSFILMLIKLSALLSTVAKVTSENVGKDSFVAQRNENEKFSVKEKIIFNITEVNSKSKVFNDKAYTGKLRDDTVPVKHQLVKDSDSIKTKTVTNGKINILSNDKTSGEPKLSNNTDAEEKLDVISARSGKEHRTNNVMSHQSFNEKTVKTKALDNEETNKDLTYVIDERVQEYSAEQRKNHVNKNSENAGTQSNMENTNYKMTKESNTHRHQKFLEGGILVISLGGGEEDVLVSQMAWLFKNHGHHVTVLLFGEGAQDELSLPNNVKLLAVPLDTDDPLRPDRKTPVSLTPEDVGKEEWASGKTIWSRLGACRRLADVEHEVMAIKPKVMVTPLFLYDVCVLALAERLHVPVVGILTSRVGAWWTWAQLGVLPHLSSAAVPLTSLNEASLWSRAGNLASHYGYMTYFRQQWQVKAMTALPTTWSPPSLEYLYQNHVRRLLLAWDPLVDPNALPVPTAIPIGGFASTYTGEVEKDILVPALLNRAGVVVVLAGTRDCWIGEAALQCLFGALNATSFTVLWKTSQPQLKPQEHSEYVEGSSTARFIFRERIPLNGILGHPRHRLLISTCGESEVMAAVAFGSPVLCLPVTTDQMLASKELQRLGMAEMLLAAEATTDRLQFLVHKLSKDRSYRLKARELAEEFHDQPTTPAERFIFHVENVMRRPSSIRYRIFGSRLYLLQQTNADVYLILIVLLVGLSVTTVFLSISAWPLLRKGLKVKNE